MNTQARRGGFTLVELLVVIAIIGILVGLIVPAVMAAVRSARSSAMAMETSTLADAFAKYEAKYNVLPPDGSSLAAVRKHFLKIFPQIASSELALLSTDNIPGTTSPLANNFSIATSSGSTTGVMDPAEAVVFFLGGYSADPSFPLSGKGGPFFIQNTNGQTTSATPPNMRTSVQYNTKRTNSFHDFSSGQLTLLETDTTVISNDEVVILGLAEDRQDLLPAYKSKGSRFPFVYFHKATYSFTESSARYFSHYTTPENGVARPYKSTRRNTRTPGATSGSVASALAEQYFQYVKPKSFQLLCAGLDDHFGGVPFTSGGGPVFFEFTSGKSINFAGFPSAAPTVGILPGYIDDGGKHQQDNLSNFSDGELIYATSE